MFFIWIILGLLSLFYLSSSYRIDIPFFTLLWLSISFLVVLISGRTKYVAFSKVRLGEFLWVLVLNLIFLGAVFVILEPLSGTFQLLIEKSLRNVSLNPNYYWIVHYDDIFGMLGFFLTNFFILIFAEELFFRGFLLQYISLKMNKFWGVLLQAFLFLGFIVILKYNLPPVENYIFLVAYTFFGRGIIGGWAASRTDSIWPSLISTSLIYSGIVYIYLYNPIF